MSILKEGEPTGSFRVDLVRPYQMYVILQNSLPIVKPPEGINAWDFIKDEPIPGVGCALSDTYFEDGELFIGESTTLDLNHIMEYPSYRFGSTLAINPYECAVPPHGFYSPERVITIQRLLAERGEKAEISSHNYWSRLKIGVSNNSYLEIDFGFQSIDDFARYHRDLLQKQDTQEGRKVRFRKINEIIEKGVVNTGIDLSLEGREGKYEHPLEFGDEQDFLKNARLYTQKYEAVIRVLHEEKGVPLPSTPIILRPPKDPILTGINLSEF